MWHQFNIFHTFIIIVWFDRPIVYYTDKFKTTFWTCRNNELIITDQLFGIRSEKVLSSDMFEIYTVWVIFGLDFTAIKIGHKSQWAQIPLERI